MPPGRSGAGDVTYRQRRREPTPSGSSRPTATPLIAVTMAMPNVVICNLCVPVEFQHSVKVTKSWVSWLLSPGRSIGHRVKRGRWRVHHKKRPRLVYIANLMWGNTSKLPPNLIHACRRRRNICGSAAPAQGHADNPEQTILGLQEATGCCDVGNLESGRNLKRLARKDGQRHRHPFTPATRSQACLKRLFWILSQLIRCAGNLWCVSQKWDVRIFWRTDTSLHEGRWRKVPESFRLASMDRASPDSCLVDNSLIPGSGPCSADLSDGPDLRASLFQAFRDKSLKRPSSCANRSFDEECPKSWSPSTGYLGAFFTFFIGKVVLFSS